MKVYVFGNKDLGDDNLAIEVAKKIRGVNFKFVPPNADLPFTDEGRVVIMDVVSGLSQAELLTGDVLDKLIVRRSITAHDYDLGFQLKYLKKLGKLGEVFVIGLPQNREPDYLRIQSIFKKLVAQDMQGS